ncbi:C1 family peptidase [Apilactobacillus timberlakei]|uniref:aminopeptidase C n=1 Tax=Apilactobacillus timberlakei TaxID=2008380 RepID=UPI001128D65A|nr:C1 family peptidase [Apilactobacillus timberlakei]TPR17679.1 aminopeptidase [Apilactobacillus timberlakei]TPR19701.1 aminopeptidase [Apilactobacillus timberlakei]TPR21207.1 aminopeptidase [Apilactobacillus timberlakei]TPR22414.1 aminopeptidase [Apilactobacillus timberlakei]
MGKSISLDNVKKYQQDLDNRKEAKILQRAISHDGVAKTSSNYSSVSKMDPVFSLELDTGEVSNQKHSGRCWIFAALNTMRHNLAKNFNLNGDFELSQIYTTFWDKFEKSNWFLENIIKTADQPLTSRRVAWLLETPQQDGGQWDMLCAVIEKYGVVPQSAMPETFNSNDTTDLNSVLNLKLRKDAIQLRKLVKDGSDVESAKDEMLNDIYRILVYTLGEPTKEFNFEYRDHDKNYHIDKKLTPNKFFDKYVNLNLEDYVSFINSPTDDKPYNKTYTIDMLGNVVGGRQVKHLNIDIDTFEKLAIKQIQNGESVWFGSDVVQNSDRKMGIMDDGLYSKDELFDTDLSLSKAEQLDYKESVMDHAMVLTGVDIVDGQPTKWKVENSWGNKVGTKGYFVMSESWFRRFAYQVVINKKYLSDELKDAQAKDPVVLDPWDPMGTLAFYEK